MRPDPYKPRVQPERTYHGRAVDDPKRPWLALLPDETEVERQRRLSKTCWHCGVFIAEGGAVLNRHEADHDK